MTDQNEHESGGRGGWVADIRLCLMFLSRLPVSAPGSHGRNLASAMRAFPLAGGIIGALGGLICVAALWLGLPEALAALLAIAGLLLITGGLHEDGLADVADGFGGGVSEERKLEIMKDSRIGSYGVLALICALMLKAAALTTLLSSGVGALAVVVLFVALGAASRTFCVSLMATTQNVRKGGVAASAGVPSPVAHQIALATGGAIAAVCLVYGFGFVTMLAVFGISAAAFLLVRNLAVRQIGGHTGDVAGAVQVVTETAMLTCLTAFV